VLFDNSFETEGLTALLRQFEPTLEVQVVPDLDGALAELAAREEVAWLVVDADWLGEVADAGVAELVEQANGARLVVFGKATAAHETDEAARFLRLGASAWVPRRFSPQAVMAVLTLLRAGERFHHVAKHDETGAAAAIATSSSKGNQQTLAQFSLTAAEHEVLLRMAQGETNLQIALDLAKS
jgi:DNA-binding NarL/FixJ family response regulator